jgi:hypothetical protein
MMPKPSSSKKKKQLSNDSLPYLQWELRSINGYAQSLIRDYPLSGHRNKTILAARLLALDCILSNQQNGLELIIPNFSRIRAEELGFSRSIFLDVLEHLCKVALVGREGAGYARSIITYSSRLRKYLPTRVVFQPLSPIVVKLKSEGITLAKIDTEDRRDLNQRLRRVWSFLQKHEISPGIDRQTFNIFNQLETEVYRKKNLIYPDPAKILPHMVFNDRDLTMGGRMYGAFWIGEKKMLRRAITINGELTADIDGKGMHVQLLYSINQSKMPSGDPYIYTDERRSITKKLMLLMMNTKTPMSPEEGRQAVARTFRKHYGSKDEVADLILELESHHHQIIDHLYKPNWGELHATEAGIMLSIMEAGIKDDIVVLPVHDGCLCQRKYKDKVLGYFRDKQIDAAENAEHYKPLPVEEAIRLLAAARRFAQAA